MLSHLGAAARSLRLASQLRQIDIAVAAGCSEAVVSRFECGQRWPARVDELVHAYATQVGVDELHIWRTAVGLWKGL